MLCSIVADCLPGVWDLLVACWTQSSGASYVDWWLSMSVPGCCGHTVVEQAIHHQSSWLTGNDTLGVMSIGTAGTSWGLWQWWSQH